MTERPLLVIARSAGLLTQAARSAGYRTVVVDAFGDRDTRRAATAYRRLKYQGEKIESRALYATLNELIASYGEMPILWGSGWEASGHILCALAARYQVLGSRPQALLRLGNPNWHRTLSPTTQGDEKRNLSNRAEALTGFAPARFVNDGSKGLLVKARNRAGGHSVHEVVGERFLPSSAYFQAFVAGRSISALCLSDGRDAKILGWSEHFKLQQNSLWAFRHSGAVSIPPLPVGAELFAALRCAVEKLGLVGLFGCDFIEDESGELILVDLNPRPTATAPLHLSLSEMIKLHLLPERLVGVESGAAASAIVYADIPIRIPKKLDWPPWTSDLPDESRVYHSAEPICTIWSRAETAQSAKSLLVERFNDLITMLRRSK